VSPAAISSNVLFTTVCITATPMGQVCEAMTHETRFPREEMGDNLAKEAVHDRRHDCRPLHATT
jgi:hypothetical protein